MKTPSSLRARVSRASPGKGRRRQTDTPDDASETGEATEMDGSEVEEESQGSRANRSLRNRPSINYDVKKLFPVEAFGRESTKREPSAEMEDYYAPAPPRRSRGSGPRGRSSRRARGRGRGRGMSRRAANVLRDESVEMEAEGATPVDSEAAEDEGEGEGEGEEDEEEDDEDDERDYKDIKGKRYYIEDDEIILPADPKGDSKIDENGVLQGDRQFTLPTFTSSTRPNPKKHFMLAIDAARAAGFRDSLYFFRRNLLVHKLVCTASEKDALIAEGKLQANLKARQVTMVVARNMYKVFGAKVIKNGRYVTDDYYESLAPELGHIEGEPTPNIVYDPDYDSGTLAIPKRPGQPYPDVRENTSALYDRRTAPAKGISTVSGTTTSMTSSNFGGTGVVPFGPKWNPFQGSKPANAHLTPGNWMYEHALAMSKFSQAVCDWRARNMAVVDLGTDTDEEAGEGMQVDGVEATEFKRPERFPLRGWFETHTNVPHVRRCTQAESAKIEMASELPLIEGATPEQAAAAARAGFASISYVVKRHWQGDEAWESADRTSPAWRPADLWHFGPRTP